MLNDQLALSYHRILVDYLKSSQETCFYQVAQFGKEMMNKGMGTEFLVEMHLEAVKKINKDKRTYPKKTNDESFTFLMEGSMVYGLAY